MEPPRAFYHQGAPCKEPARVLSADMSAEEPRVRKRGLPVACPFCATELPRPAPLAGADERSGGRCSCGAVYLLDAAGREGGQLLLDGLALLCNGDLGKALELQGGTDYQVQSCIYNARQHSFEPAPVRRSAYGVCKLWFLRRNSPG